MFDKRTACGHIDGPMDSQKVTQKSQCTDSEDGEEAGGKEAKLTQLEQRKTVRKS